MLIRIKNYDPDVEDEKYIEEEEKEEEVEDDKEKSKVKEKEFGPLGAGTVAYQVLQKRTLLKERIVTVGEELEHPLTR